MSKPKPGLGKGIVRTLAVAQYPPSTSGILTLAPTVGQHSHPHTLGYSAAASGASTQTQATRGLNGWSSHSSTSSSPSASSSSYISLLPTWDQNDIVLSYSPSHSRLRSSFKPSALPMAGPSRGIHTSTHSNSHSPSQSHSRRYSSVSVSPSAFLTPPLPPSFFFDRSLNFTSPPTPAQSSLDALLASLEIASGGNSGMNAGQGSGSGSPSGSRTHTNAYTNPSTSSDGFNLPPSPPSSSARSSPHQPLKALRPSESHTVLSAPLPQNGSDTSNNSNSISLSSHPLMALHESSPATYPASESSSDTSTVSYSSSLIFHLGASGSPKERLATRSRTTKERPPAPPRARSFPLPEIDPPTEITSIAVGEDAYFARPDGMCIADGVGGWSRSGKGGADAGRWSRLLTHFCEEEVGDWWAGKEVYLVQTSAKNRHASSQASSSENALDGKGKGNGSPVQAQGQQQPKQGWAKELWEDRDKLKSTTPTSASGHDDVPGHGQKKNRERRPLDPVEIMQRGFEKCLACVLAEGGLGSSTCLLALLHNSTLHIANLGDCCLLLIRQGEVVFRTSEMQHAFNFPLQVGTHSRDEPMKDAMRYDIGVKKGDVVVLGSDGLMDNLFDEDILEIVAQFTSPKSSSSVSTTRSPSPASSYPTPPATPPSSQRKYPPFNPQHISDALCRKARSVSELVTATTPFMCKAIEEGIDFVGGKKDDISVLVGVIGDREDGQSTGDQGRSTGGLQLHL
ncbi:hypothetical protein I317_06285 [Kwoniella heveanensis CBS 569]|uniref:Protein phosphatase n=1 Tax=Kwoniella heveanensis BCC8398 TaxID=1296120 RepID=A0A1B9GV95_9TREE|nr:hypothetical protein I316_03494 [Kwoniella heveanensis BCC8398]OCF39911.1 hypothetical protein I317_06285 [Kwoniella heveanensis CBS 569]